MDMYKFHISRDDYMYVGCKLNMAEDQGSHFGVLQLDRIEIVSHPKGEIKSSSPLSLTDDEAQDLLQALWNAGYRPNNGESSIAHINALNYHLEDMRKLVFKND